MTESHQLDKFVPGHMRVFKARFYRIYWLCEWVGVDLELLHDQGGDYAFEKLFLLVFCLEKILFFQLFDKLCSELFLDVVVETLFWKVGE